MERYALSLKNASPNTLPNVAIRKTVFRWLYVYLGDAITKKRQVEQQTVPFPLSVDFLPLIFSDPVG